MAIKAFELFGEISLKGTGKVNKDLDGVDDKAKSTGSKLAKSLGTGAKRAGLAIGAGLATGAVAITGFALKGGMQLEATQAKFDTVFGDMAGSMDKTIDQFQKLTPATQASARSMVSGIQDLLVPLGFARDEATGMTGDTLQLVGALTNFNSATHSAEDVASAFQSALTGSTESLKAVGIQVDETSLKQKALELGLLDVNGEMSKQARATALLQLATEQSGDALAAYNKESLDSKTKMEIAKKGMEDVVATLGLSLLPIIEKVSPLIVMFGEMVAELAPVFIDTVLPAIEPFFELLMQIIEEVMPQLLPLFLQLVAGVLPMLVNILMSIIPVLIPIVEMFLELAMKILPALTPLFDLLLVIMEALEPLFALLVPLVEALSPAFEAITPIIEAVIGIMVTAVEWIERIISGLKSAIEWLAKYARANAMRAPRIGGSTTPNDGRRVQSSLPFGVRANGGEIFRTGPYLVGERGPEVVQLEKGNNVIANGKSGGVNLTINTNSNPSPYELSRIMKKQLQLQALRV